MKKSKAKTIVGRTEKVDFPEFEIKGIEAKIDTGAYSTAIHANKIWLEELDGKETLHFELINPTKKEDNKRTFNTQKFSRKKVRSSNGRLESRYALKTKIILGGKTRITDLTLTNRGKMRYPVLVGRKVLKKGYLVDVSKKSGGN